MDGIASKGSGQSGSVVVLATSNCPWDLDEALRRRLEKRIHIPLPDLAAREQMFALNLGGVRTHGDIDCSALAAATEGCVYADHHAHDDKVLPTWSLSLCACFRSFDVISARSACCCAYQQAVKNKMPIR